MKTGYKFLIGGGILASIAGAYTYLKRMGRASKEIETVTNIKPNLKKQNFDILITVKNPTGGHFILKHPFVKLLYKDSVVGTSKSLNKDYQVPAFGEAKIDPIAIAVPLLSFLTTGGDIFNELRKGSPVTLQVDTVTTAIESKTKTQIPVKKSQVITLKQA